MAIGILIKTILFLFFYSKDEKVNSADAYASPRMARYHLGAPLLGQAFQSLIQTGRSHLTRGRFSRTVLIMRNMTYIDKVTSSLLT